MTLWQGRFGEGMAEVVAEFTVSLPFDAHWRVDLVGSKAHVRGLGVTGS